MNTGHDYHTVYEAFHEGFCAISTTWCIKLLKLGGAALHVELFCGIIGLWPYSRRVLAKGVPLEHSSLVVLQGPLRECVI